MPAGDRVEAPLGPAVTVLPNTPPRPAAHCSHDWMDGYRWLTPDIANARVRNPDERRQQLVAALMEQPQRGGRAGALRTQQQHPD